jgi:peptide alpha-N-acetyltransferase
LETNGIYLKENQQILRDLAMAQAQMRDYNGLMQTRFQLLMLKPNQKNNWIACAVAAHLRNEHTRAAAILDIYDKYFTDVRNCLIWQ